MNAHPILRMGLFASVPRMRLGMARYAFPFSPKIVTHRRTITATGRSTKDAPGKRPYPLPFQSVSVTQALSPMARRAFPSPPSGIRKRTLREPGSLCRCGSVLELRDYGCRSAFLEKAFCLVAVTRMAVAGTAIRCRLTESTGRCTGRFRCAYPVVTDSEGARCCRDGLTGHFSAAVGVIAAEFLTDTRVDTVEPDCTIGA